MAMRPLVTLIAALAVLGAGLAGSGQHLQSAASGSVAKTCPRGTVRAVIAGKRTCLRAGQRCKRSLDRRYHHYGFHCHGARLTRPSPPPKPRFVKVEVTGPPEVVFDWTTDRCDDPDIPDLPARAFRDADGKIQLISTHYVGRRLIGADLDHLQRDCTVVSQSGFDDDPAHFDDREWISATWTPDGRKIYALLHDEYQGHTHPGRCPSGDYFKCWYNAVTLAVSTDTGRSYLHPSQKLVAAIPYPYEPDVGPRGMFAPSNIVHNARDGYFYAFTWMQIGSRFGTCLMRTKDLSQPGSWRAWSDERQFATTFVDPYGPNPDPEAHVCRPVFGDPNSVTKNAVAHQWIGLIGGAGEQGGFYYSVSTDLISWTSPRLFLAGESPTSYRCGDQDPILYPSLIDPSSTTRNFETSDGSAYVYYTQFHYHDCQQTLDRDLVRVPIRISPY